MAKRRRRKTLYHYTDEKGLNGIVASQRINPSTFARSPADVRDGEGQYLSDIAPASKTPAELSREFLGFPFQKRRFTHFVEIDVTGFKVTKGRTGVFVIPSEQPLDVAGASFAAERSR